MKTLLISDGIMFIEDRAFINCRNLSKVTFPITLNRIGSEKHPAGRRFIGAFENSGIIRVSLPEGLKKLGESTFRGCDKMISIDMPNGITEIEDYTFESCRSLEKIVLPENLAKIGHSAFSGCSKMEDVQFPLSLKEIGNYVFSGCYSLTAIILNEGLKKIGDSAFTNCTKLSKILIPSTVSEIGGKYDDVFTVHGWYQPTDRRRKGWATSSPNPNLTIYCYSGSYALEYAREKGYPVQNAANFVN